MSTSIVLNADSFSDATDAFRVRCTVPILVCLSEQDIATQPAPPHLAFKVPETSVLSSLSRPIHEGFRRYLAEPNQAPLFWLSRDAAGKDPVPWSMPTGLLAQYVQHEKDLDDDDAAAQAHNKFKKVHVVFPIKLYAHFRVTKKGEVFPFHAANMSGSQLVDALFGNALHAFKRSAAIMNPDTFAKFTGKLQPEQMKDLYDLTMMDAVSISRRSELSKFSKGILSSIKVKSWPVMIHSLESGKTLTLAIPARVLIVDSKETVDEQTTSPTDHFNDTDSSSSAGSPVIVRGIQGQFIAHRQMKKKTQQQHASNKKNNNDDNNVDDDDNDDDSDDENDENKRPTTFGDFVKCLHHRINPGHLDENLNNSASSGGGVASPTAAVSSEEELALDLLRRRLIVGGLPDAPLPETPLAWLMEHLVGSDLALHILLLPPNHHTK